MAQHSGVTQKAIENSVEHYVNYQTVHSLDCDEWV